MLNSAVSVNEGEYERILDKLAAQYVDNFCDDHAPGSEFFPLGTKKKRCKEEFKENFRMEELGNYLKEAVSLLFNEGKQHLDDENWEVLYNELLSAKKAFLELSLGDEMPNILYPRLGFTNRGLEAIDSMARKLYTLKEYTKAISLNVFLTILNGEQSIYWYNLGICFQEVENYEKAILAYGCCKEIDPKNIGPYLFSAECELGLNNRENAKFQLEESEKLVNILAVKDPWDQLVSSLKSVLV